MKSIFIAYDQAYNMEIADALQILGVRGFTMWQDIAGRGSETGAGIIVDFSEKLSYDAVYEKGVAGTRLWIRGRQYEF